MSNTTFTLELNHAIADEFRNSFASNTSSYYLFFGQVNNWPGAVPVPNTNWTYLQTVHEDIMGAKRVTGESVRIVAPRVNYANGSVYSQYNGVVDWYTSNTNIDPPNYVIANTNVFLCMANNAGGLTANSPDEESISTDDGFLSTNDGYKWKYLFTIQDETGDNLFYTDDWFPVPAAAAAGAAVIPGTIDRIEVLSGGADYTDDAAAELTIVGDGTGATAQSVVSGGAVLSVEVLNRGTGYTYASVVHPGNPTVAASFQVVMSPPAGHGAYPQRDIHARDLFLALRLGRSDATEGGKLTTNNAFHQFGLLRNPVKKDSTNNEIEVASVISQTYDFTVSDTPLGAPTYPVSSSVYQVDSVTGLTVFTGTVVDQPSPYLVRVSSTQGIPLKGGEVLLKIVSGGTEGKVVSIKDPDLERYSGDILFIENINTLQRSPTQSEAFRIVFEF